MGVSALMTGLVIVGFGTSMPELVVSLDAAVSQRPDLALGNVVGSNIANLLLILAICALITPLAVHPLALTRDATGVVLASILFVVLALTGELSRLAGGLFLLGLATYLAVALWSERRHARAAAEVYTAEAEQIRTFSGSVPGILLAVIGGLALLIGGSRLLLTGAVSLALELGVSEAAIGLTLVAVGTSLPELSITVVAAVRRQADVAVGNLLGSNLFNLLGILGLAAVIQPLAIHGRMLVFDQWAMLGTAVVVLAFLFTGRRLSRIEGAILLALYIGYILAGFHWFDQ